MIMVGGDVVAHGARSSPPDSIHDEPAARGSVESKVRADVDALITSHPMGESLAETAFTLARTLDQGAGLATAAVSRELRATLETLARYEAGGDDDLGDELSTPGLPSEVRDPETD